MLKGKFVMQDILHCEKCICTKKNTWTMLQTPSLLNDVIYFTLQNQLTRLRNEKGHDTEEYSPPGSVVQGISVTNAGVVRAAADYRKGGTVDGF